MNPGDLVTVTYTGTVKHWWADTDPSGWSVGCIEIDGFLFTVPKGAVVEKAPTPEPDPGAVILDLRGFAWQNTGGSWVNVVHGMEGPASWDTLLPDVARVVYRP